MKRRCEECCYRILRAMRYILEKEFEVIVEFVVVEDVWNSQIPGIGRHLVFTRGPR
jgi:hypothetical protein